MDFNFITFSPHNSVALRIPAILFSSWRFHHAWNFSSTNINNDKRKVGYMRTEILAHRMYPTHVNARRQKYAQNCGKYFKVCVWSVKGCISFQPGLSRLMRALGILISICIRRSQTVTSYISFIITSSQTNALQPVVLFQHRWKTHERGNSINRFWTSQPNFLKTNFGHSSFFSYRNYFILLYTVMFSLFGRYFDLHCITTHLFLNTCNPPGSNPRPGRC